MNYLWNLWIIYGLSASLHFTSGFWVFHRFPRCWGWNQEMVETEGAIMADVHT
jgi:hypothetical protein